jgi:hypothetical protein
MDIPLGVSVTAGGPALDEESGGGHDRGAGQGVQQRTMRFGARRLFDRAGFNKVARRKEETMLVMRRRCGIVLGEGRA